MTSTRGETSSPWALARGIVALIELVSLWTVSTVEANAVGRCSARTTANWDVSPDRRLTIEGFTDGPDCIKAVVVIVIRAPSGETLWVDARAAASVMSFAGVGATNVAGVKKAVEEWIAGAPSFRRMDALPDWPQAAATPSTKLWSQNDETGFPFEPESNVDREAYSAMRQSKLPLFCYVTGMESLTCVVATPDGSIEKVGRQMFPG